MKKPTLQEELDLRYESAMSIKTLQEELNKTVEFLRQKMEFYFMRAGYVNIRFINAMFDTLKAELWDIIERVKLLQVMSKTAILPLMDKNNLCVAIKSLRFLMTLNVLGGVDKEKIESVKRLAMTLNQELTKTLLYFDSAYTHGKDKFTELQERYANDHPNRMEMYLKEVPDIRHALKSLRLEYKDERCVNMWYDSDGDMERVFEMMSGEGFLEKDIVPLIEFILKYDAIQERLEEIDDNIPDNVTIGHYHAKGSVNVENIDKLDNLTRDRI